MEESVSPELAQANEPEPSQDPLDTSSQEPASVSEVNDQKEQCDVSEEKVEDSEKSSKPSCEFKKTWGFRRTTIAKREIPGDMAAETPEGKGAPVRRSGRQAKRTDKLEEFLVTVKRGRGTGRRSGPSRLEGGDPPSQTPTDAETASEASFDGNAEAKTEERKAALTEKRKRGRGRARRAVKPKAGGGSVSEDGSSENEEENGGDVTKDTQEHVETEPSIEDKKDEESKDGEVMDVKKEEEDDEEEKIIKSKESSNESVNRRPVKAVSKDSKKDTTSKKGAKLRKENKEDDDDNDEDDNDDEDDESSSSESDSDGYDPNALYCICRQKHNKRFMICCDRCEEWFHGDCVGITEARGRLMERNGEDYVCPNCNTQRGQTPKGHASTPAAENGKRPAALPRKTEPSLAAGGTPTSSSNAVATTEEKAADDLGIKGRIEKATNPSGKKKIKIFQPVAAEGSSLPKCIGPGCERDALPDSVYCGNDCILRHAAAAMKTITTDGKDSKQKEKSKPKVQKKTTNKSAHKKTSGPERRSSNQAEEEDSDSGAEENDDDDDDEDKHAEEHPPPPAMSSWSSDHNYIAVTPEKTTPISPSVLNKASTAQKDKEKEDNEDIKPEKETASADKKTPASNVAPKGGKKSPGSKGTKAAVVLSPMKGKTSAAPLSSARDSKKQPLPLGKLGKSKKPGPPPLPIPGLSPPVPPGSRHHVSGALRVAKSTFTIPKKQPQVGQKETAEPGPSLPTKTPPSSVSSTPSTQHSLSKPAQSAAPAAPPQPPPNNQMRSNIRRSLTDILYKRVSDSDDLSMSESEVGKLAVTIEKEMFNLYMNTDNKYKNKYRSLMFNLKDPKNKGLFYRVIGGEISPFRLVRLSPEELLSKEMSDWRKTEISEGLDIGGKSQSGQSKTGSRQDGVPTDVDMEEAPPMSDGDVCIPATSQSPRLASSADPQEDTRPTSAPQASASTGKTSAMPDIFSSMLKDTTAEHRAHLFDLNCKICTGQKSADDEPPSKKTKMSVPKKPEPPIKSKPEPRPSKAPAVDLPQTSSYSSVETSMSESVSMMEDPTSKLPVIQAPVTAAVPAVSSVTITRRDPRTAGHRSSAPVSQTGPDICIPAVQASVPVPVPVELPGVEVKGPLPMPPAAPVSLPRPGTHKGASSHFGSSTPSSVSEPPPEDETALFLSGQEMMWKGFINMHTVAKFVTKAYMVSGSFEHIKEDLPDTIHIGGRISPHTVWDYVGKLKTSLSKELCLIRFHPATEEEEVAYVSLFSYFSSRKRFGVVANSNKRIKDLYLIPLSSKDPLPAKLLPFDGPGLEPARPNLLLGLLICQKDKKRPGAPLENEEKRSKIIRDDETGLPKLSTVGKSEIKQDKGLRSSLDAISTTPPGTPPPLNATEPSSSTAVASVFSLLSSVKASAVTTSTGNNSPSSNVTAVPAVSSTPLQTILKTLFGKKKQDTDVSSPSDQSAADASVPSVSLLDPIVQQFAITKGKEVEIQDDRPYDPEEEYDPTVGYGTEKTHDTTKLSVPIKQPLGSSGVVDDIAYDPEDDSIFDDVRVDPGSKKLTEQQKVLEDKQTEEEKRHLEGHEESIHQIPETLISQPATSILASSQLLQLGKKVEELVAKSSGAPVINQRRDPRQSRDPRQAAANRRQTSDSVEKEELSPVTTDKPTLQQATVIDASPSQACTTTDTPTTLLPLSVDASVEEPSTTTDTQVTQMTQVTATLDSQQVEPTIPQDASTPEEGGISEVLPFLETENTEVSIPLLGEKIDPELVENYMEKEPEEKPELKDSPIESESKSFEEVWPNSASILKTDQVSTSGLPIESTATTYYSISTISSSSTSVHSGMQQDASHDNSSYMDSHASHIQHITTTNPTTIPPPMSFPPPIGPPPILGPPPMQGPLPMAVPPPMHLPPPMSGPPPMQIPPMQGPPPSLGEKDSQYPLPGSYPPYQNQWGSGPQYDAPRGPPPPNFAPRGPPPFQPVSQRVPPPPQMFDNSIPPQHIGPRGPPPGPPPLGPPPPNFEGQRFNGPPPPFGFSGPRGPPPPFPGPLPNHFDNRAPPPSHFSGPRGPPPPHNIGDHGPPPNISRGPGDKYDDSGSSYHQRKEQPQIPSQGPPFRGPPPNHFDGRRGPPGPTGDMSGQRFPPPSQFRGSPQHRGSFEEPQRSSSQDFERHRGSSVEQFGGPRGPPPGHYDKDAVPQSTRYNYNEDNPNDVRPVRGPLLPTPPEGPIPVPGRVGGHSPETHRDDHWRRHSPEMRRRSCSTRDGSEPHSRPSRFDGTSRDRDGPSRLSEERQRDLSEDRRRERDREGGHGGRSWGWNREHEWDRGRERDRERDRSRERDRERGRSREREREREREHSRERDRSRGRESDRHRDGDSEKRRDRDRDRDRGREREQDRKDHDRDRAKIRDRDRDRDRDSRDRRRERSRSRDRERGKDRDRRDRDRDRDKDRGKEKDRDRRDKSRSKEKKDDRKEKSDSRANEKSVDSETQS